MFKKEENMVKLKRTLPLKQMIAYERCMKTDVLNPHVVRIRNSTKKKDGL